MSATRPFSSAIVLSILATVACSGSTPPAQSLAAAAEPAPPSEPAAPTAKAEKPAADDADTKAAKQAKERTSESAESSSPAPAKKAENTPPPLPSAILTAENVAFELDEEASAVRLILQDKCEQRVGYEEEAIAKCVESERSKFPADVLRFRKMGGQLRWTVYKRRGDQMQVVFSAPFAFTEESDFGVSLLVQEGGTGYQPLLSQARSVPLRFPATDTIELDDPVWGQLVYKAKTGLVE